MAATKLTVKSFDDSNCTKPRTFLAVPEHYTAGVCLPDPETGLPNQAYKWEEINSTAYDWYYCADSKDCSNCVPPQKVMLETCTKLGVANGYVIVSQTTSAAPCVTTGYVFLMLTALCALRM